MEGRKRSEDDFVRDYVNYFNKFFRVTEQVWSKCGGGRIDILLKTGMYYFGVECKKDESKKGEEIGEYVKQAIRYTKYEFEIEHGIYKKIPILICPSLSYKYFLLNNREIILPQYATLNGFAKWHQDRHEETNKHHSFNGFLGAFGIGEVRKSEDKRQKWAYFSHSNKPVWSSRIKYNWNTTPPTKLNEIDGVDQRWYGAWIKKIEKA